MKQKHDEAATLWLLLLTRLYKQIHRYYEIAFVGELLDRLLFLIETWQISGVFRFGLTGQRNPAALRQARLCPSFTAHYRVRPRPRAR